MSGVKVDASLLTASQLYNKIEMFWGLFFVLCDIYVWFARFVDLLFPRQQ